MSRQVSPSTSKVYGVERVTHLWGVSRATVYRHRRPDRGERRRPGPVGAMPDAALVGEIRKLLEDSPFHGEGHRKLWARLRFPGIRTSRRDKYSAVLVYPYQFRDGRVVFGEPHVIEHNPPRPAAPKRKP